MRSSKKTARQKNNSKETPSNKDNNMDDVTERAVHDTVHEADRFTRDLTDTSKRATQANAKLIADQAEALRHMWQTNAEMASNLTRRSADQVALTLGIGGDETEKAAAQISGNLRALTQSASVVANGARAMSTEWVDLVRHGTERSMDHMATMMRCGSPQEFVTAQTDALRDNLEMLMDSSRRIADIALRTAEDASREIERNAKSFKPGE